MTRHHASLGIAALAVAAAVQSASAHVTIKSTGPLTASGTATVSVVVPNERTEENSKVVIDVPDDFLQAGGRVSRVEFPSGWTVHLEKADKPADVYAKEMEARKARSRPAAETGEHAAPAADPTAKAEQEAANEARKRWIKQVVFEGGVIPVDGFQEFKLSLQLPEHAGKFRFPATQVYADGKEVGWVELVEGAEHPAPTLAVIERAAEPSAWKPLAAPFGAALAGLLVGFALVRASMGRSGRSVSAA